MSLFIPLLLSSIIYAKETPQHWLNLAEQDINEAIKIVRNEGIAKNVILFVGDGMDLNTVSASRVYKGKNGETQPFIFDKFGNVGLLKTYSANKLVPDSASTATALFTGVKVNHYTAGVDATVQENDCEASLKPGAQLRSIMDWAQDAGKATGFVTTTRVTHATPSALYAHTAQRHWECEAKQTPEKRKCKDIARQLIEDEPGKDLNVIFGGGRQVLQSHVDARPNDPIDRWACYSGDGRDLIHEWKLDKSARAAKYAYVENRHQLSKLPEDTDYVLGIFANSHMYLRNDNGTLNVRSERRRGQEDPPSLKEMVEKAIRVLQRNDRGFVLMVEGGLIDYAHHRGTANAALYETNEFNEAIIQAQNMTNSEDTLIIVTSDHAHTFIFAGYADRNQGVTGIAGTSKMTKTPYTSLLYGTGGPNNFQFSIRNGTIERRDPSRENTAGFSYSQQSGIFLDESIHSGADVVVYADGPWAHLFTSVHEQTYVAHVISYAAKIGHFRDRSEKQNSTQDSGQDRLNTCLLFIFVPLLLLSKTRFVF